MLEETTPRTSTKWVPHSTFAQEMGLTEKGITVAGSPATEIEEVTPEKQV
jgi:hypothetical protein